jgi:Methyltransferase domain
MVQRQHSRHTSARAPAPVSAVHEQLGLPPGQSVELLKALHILTREGKLNQDSRRKLKQVNHLLQFIEPLLSKVLDDPSNASGTVTLADHGAGKSYLGFLLYDRFFQQRSAGHVYGIETRAELVERSRELARGLGFARMSFLPLSVQAATTSTELPPRIDVVTALHACDTATDDAIDFALAKQARHVVLVPCCQAEVAAALRKHKALSTLRGADSIHTLSELWRHPLHAREFGSHITNVLRCLRLEAHGYQVTVTELVGWEHSLKNELILASHGASAQQVTRAGERLAQVLQELALPDLVARFSPPAPV